jgi:hypothetical protein
MRTVAVTPAQSQMVRTAQAAVATAEAQLRLIVSTLAAGHVLEGSRLERVEVEALHFSRDDDGA